MRLGRERRLNCRLYMDRQGDALVIEMLDRLLIEKHFLNQTELIKHGIKLAYKEMYEKFKENKPEAMCLDEKKLAKAIAREVKPEIEVLMENFLEKRRSDLENFDRNVGAKEGAKTLEEGNDVAQEIVGTEDSSKEMALSGQTINFLKGLNAD